MNFMQVIFMEKNYEQYLVKTVEALGGKAFKFNSLSNRGVSDRIVCLPDGSTWFIEMKTETGRLSALQKVFAKDMAALNQKYACLNSKEAVDRWACELTKK